jgi:hypothetical protein
MYPMLEQLSPTTVSVLDGLNRCLARRGVSLERASWVASLQRSVAEDVRAGRYTKDQGAALLHIHRAYGREGKKALA